MVRATHGALHGSYYYEMQVDNSVGAARVGVVTESAPLDAPVGYDKFSISYGSKAGVVVRDSRPQPYGKPFGCNDTIGVVLRQPTDRSPRKTMTYSPVVETNHHKQSEVNPRKYWLRTTVVDFVDTEGTEVVFYLNGVCQGSAVANFPQATYFPAVSLYRGCQVSFRFEPPFRFLPPDYGRGLEAWDAVRRPSQIST